MLYLVFARGGVYLYLKGQKKEIEKPPDSCDNIFYLKNSDLSVPGLGIGKADNQLN